MTPKVAVCVPYRPRNPHDAHLRMWTELRWRTLFPEWGYHAADAGGMSVPFNQSASRNLAAVDAGAVDCLIFCNADTACLDPEEVSTAVTSAMAGTWVLPALYVETAERYTMAALASDAAAPMVDPLSDYVRQLPDSPAGPQIMSREAFEAVGGWDERCKGWGIEDRCIADALDVLTGPHARIGTTVHLHHPRGREDTFRARTYPANKAHHGRLYRRALRERDPERRRAAMLAVVAGNRAADVHAGG